jgi:MFS family permease
MGSLSALALPARDSMLTQVSPPGGLQNAVSLVVAAQFGTQMFGMALAGGAAIVGPEPLLILQGAIFVLSLFLARQLPAHPPHPNADSGLKARIHAVEEGFVAATRSPIILPVIIAMTGVGLFYVGSFMSIVPIIIRDGYQGDAAIFSLVNVCFWGGTILATVGLMRVGAIHRRGRLLLLALCTGLSVLALMSIVWPLWAFCLLCTAWGMGAGVTITMGRTIVQEAAPPRMRARVLAFYQLGFSGGGPIGALSLGFVVEALGPFQAVYVPSVAMALVLILLVTTTRLWHISPASH